MNTTDSAKTILCYGDSNTWGAIPRSDERYPRSVRWPGALQKMLGEKYDVISEGLCGRTFIAMDATKQHKSGINQLHSIMESHEPVDLVIIMLGTNDVKTTYDLTVDEIAQDLEETIFFIKGKKLGLEKIPQILIICPPPVIEPKTKDLDERMVRGPEMFKQLPALYEEIALRHGCSFIDAGKHIASSLIDGYHLDKEAHLALAKVVGEKVREMVL